MQKRKTSDVPEKQFLLDAITVHDSWRLFKILAELVDGFEVLSISIRRFPFSVRPASDGG